VRDKAGLNKKVLFTKEPLINANEAAKPKAKINEKAQFMGDK